MQCDVYLHNIYLIWGGITSPSKIPLSAYGLILSRGKRGICLSQRWIVLRKDRKLTDGCSSGIALHGLKMCFASIFLSFSWTSYIFQLKAYLLLKTFTLTSEIYLFLCISQHYCVLQESNVTIVCRTEKFGGVFQTSGYCHWCRAQSTWNLDLSSKTCDWNSLSEIWILKGR